MKTAYRKHLGYILFEAATGKRLASLTSDDARDLAGDRMSYDRRRSFTNAKNRSWAGGVRW